MNYIKHARAVFILAILSVPSLSVAQEKAKTKAEWLAGANTVFAGMCAEAQKDAQRAASPAGLRLAKQSAEMWCTCGPAEMERRMAELSDPVPKEVGLGSFTQTTSICTGKQIRTATIETCPNDQEVVARGGDIGAYCACVESRLSAMTDEQLNVDLSGAYNNEIREARANGKPLVFRETFALRKYGVGCETPPK